MKIQVIGAVEMALKLRVLGALVHDLNSAPTSDSSQLPAIPTLDIQHLLLTSVGTCTCVGGYMPPDTDIDTDAYTHAYTHHTTHIYNVLISS